MYIGCRAVIISIFITFLLLCSTCSAENPYLDPMVTTHELVTVKTFNGFATSWYYSPGLTTHEYIIAIQNLEDVNRETNITSLISNTNFNLDEISNIIFEEYKEVPYTYTIDHYDEIEHSGWDSINQTWVYWTEQIFNYTETIEDEKLDFKPCKMNTFSLNSAELKENYGYMLIPKYDSKDKGDGTFNGTKIFKLTFSTPIEVTQNGYGSSGMVALLLDDVEFCPYWKVSFSNRKPITITTNGTSTPANYQVLLNISYESEMQVDFDDIRFTNSSNGEIAYWIKSKVDSNFANVWVNLSDANTDPGSDTIWVYYGNTTVSDGGVSVDVFPAQFNGDSTGWTEVDPNNHITFQNNRLEFSGLNRGESAYVYKAITPMQYDWVAEWTITFTAKRNSAHVFSMGISSEIDDLYSHSGDSVGFDYLYSDVVDDALYIWEVDGGSASNTATSGTTAPDTRYMRAYRTGDMVYVTAYNDSARTSAIESTISKDITGVTATNLDNYYILSSLHATGTAFMSGYVDNHICRKYIVNEPTVSYGTAQYFVDSLHYNNTNPYNHTIEFDGTLTSNHSIITADDTNDTVQSTGTSYLQINVYDNAADIVRNFTFTGDNLDWYQVANISGTYDLKNVSGTVETQSNGNFTTNLIPGTYWIVAAATTTGYTVSGTIYGAAGLGEGQVTVTLGSDSTTTSSSGSYSFTNISSGTYTLTASKPGLQDVSTTITVSGDTTQDLTMARAVSPGGGGQQSSDWALPFNISTPISRLDGLFTSLQVPSDPGKINLFWYCIAGFGLFMFVDGTAFHFDKSRNNPVIKLKYRISAPLSLVLMFLGLLYIGLINWNSAFFISTLDWLVHSSITQPAILGTGILLLGVFVFIDGTTFHFDKSRNNPVIKLKYHISAPLSLILIFIGLLYTGMINRNSVFFIRVFDWEPFSSITLADMLGTVILLLGIMAFIDGLAFYLDKSRKSTHLKIKYQVLITAGLGLGILGAVISKLLIFS